MSSTTPLPVGADHPTVSGRRARWELLLISLLLLFLELACIRWFPAHVLFLTFFTNTVLLACFLGMSVGCLVADRPRNYLTYTPVLLVLAMFAAHGVEHLTGLGTHGGVNVGNQASPQIVYFGTEAGNQDVARFVIPLEVLGGFFFLVIALAMVGPGQVLGRALGRVTNRVQAYTINIVGSLIGIALFALCSWAQLPPLWWFLPVVLGLGYFLYQRPLTLDLGFRLGLLGLILLAVTMNTGPEQDSQGTVREHLWSPYYRMDYDHAPQRRICVNLIGHQQMVSANDNQSPAYAYALPHLLYRDAQATAGATPRAFEEVMVIGAGSGNDVSRALQWGAKHIDAVEIDPVIHELGKKEHPDQPYQDPRVTVHLDDGRNFLRSTDKQYDLIVYALVDSLVLHSSYSNIRLESYLFTRQALQDVRKRLKPGGVFVMYNYFRQGWIVARLHQGLNEVFGEEPLILTLPFQKTVDPEQGSGGFTVFLSGEGTKHIRQAFAKQSEYWVSGREAPSRAAADGFAKPTAAERARWQGLSPDQKHSDPFVQFRLAQVIAPAEPLRMATDDWPFLYLRQPMIPDLSLRGAATMGGLALLVLIGFAPRRQEGGRRWPLDGRMFFLGAGFMLIETKAVVHMALLFGSTWMVNSVVFFALLVMVLIANLFVLAVRPERLWPYYVGLLAALVVNCVIPLDFFLGMERGVQVAGSCLLVFAPILFAGVIFAVSFGRSADPGRAFGANIAGAMLGGLAEYASMLVGFQYLGLVALAFYVLSAAVFKGLWLRTRPERNEQQVHELVALGKTTGSL
jgi:SAM-dependent methyltransferase